MGMEGGMNSVPPPGGPEGIPPLPGPPPQSGGQSARAIAKIDCGPGVAGCGVTTVSPIAAITMAPIARMVLARVDRVKPLLVVVLLATGSGLPASRNCVGDFP